VKLELTIERKQETWMRCKGEQERNNDGACMSHLRRSKGRIIGQWK